MENNLYLEDLEFSGRHGFHDIEKNCAQKFLISLRIFSDFSAAMESDSIGETVDYSAVYAVVKRTVEGNKFHLIERLAREIATNIFRKFTAVNGVEIGVKKYPLSWANRNYGSIGFTARFTR
jgi:dihydroneopterin aldolase